MKWRAVDNPQNERRELVIRALRLAQTGNLQTYTFLLVLGVAVVLWFVLGK